MAPGSFIHPRSAFSVVWGMCFGITVTVLIIESGHFVDVNFSRTDRGSWRDEVRRYIARMKWTEDAVKETKDSRIGSQVKVTCIIILKMKQFNDTYTTIKQTWGKHCDTILYFSDVLPLLDNVIKVENTDNMDIEVSASVLFNVLHYLYEHHMHNIDWVVRALPETYIIVENLQLFLSDKNPDDPVYYGQKFSQWGRYFPSTSAGYVMSREAIRRIATKGSTIPGCHPRYREEDNYAIARCFKILGVVFGNSLDSQNRSRFNSESVEHVAVQNFDEWYLKHDTNANITILGVSSISRSAISLAPYSQASLYALEYYLYHARRYGFVPRGIA